MGVPCGSGGKESTCNAGDLGSTDPWVGKIPPEEGMANHSGILAWRIPWAEEPGGGYTVHGVVKSRTRLSD